MDMDTAQLSGAAETDPNVALQNAADAFKAFDNPVPAQPRAPDGKFASAEQPDEEEVETELEAEAEGEEETGEDEQEAAEEAQPLPPSWPADKAEVWEALPADAKALIAERDAEQLRATNTKFQEIANARKAAEAEAWTEANTKRDELITQLEFVKTLVQPAKPDPRSFGYGTPNWNEAAYRVADAEFEQQSAALAQVNDQLKGLQDSREAEEAKQASEWIDEQNRAWAPKFAELVPDVTDPAKAAGIFDTVFRYAVDNGIDPSLLSADNVKNVPLNQILVYWKAQQFDQLRGSSAPPKPKPAGPAVKPGVSSPRSAQKSARHQQAKDRLAREGTIEAGANVWKNFL